MSNVRGRAQIVFACMLSALGANAAHAAISSSSYGRFGKVAIDRPATTPTSVAIVISGDDGWNMGVADLSHALAATGAAVIGVDSRHYFAELAKAHAANPRGCASLAGDFENLSHAVQHELGVADYHVPVLVGLSSGATLVYALLAQAPPGTFAGGISVSFRTGLPLPAPPCKAPWILPRGKLDPVVRVSLMGQLVAGYRQLAKEADPPLAAATEVRDLPLTEVAAAINKGDTLAVLLTGDGGWAGIDRQLSARLAALGIPVAGVNSLKYYWSAKTPETAATDVTRVARYYFNLWHKQRLILIGYSFGADVLPFIYNRLPADLRSHVGTVNLLGLSATATFEVHVSEWLPGSAPDGLATTPEIARMVGAAILCLHGEGERDSLCDRLPASQVTARQIGTGHHFSGDYAGIADSIIDFDAKRRVTVAH